MFSDFSYTTKTIHHTWHRQSERWDHTDRCGRKTNERVNEPHDLGSNDDRGTFLFVAYLLSKYWMLCISIINLIFGLDEKHHVFVCIYNNFSEISVGRTRGNGGSPQTICWFIHLMGRYKRNTEHFHDIFRNFAQKSRKKSKTIDFLIRIYIILINLHIHSVSEFFPNIIFGACMNREMF